MKKILSLLVTIVVTCSLWAGNIITYKASSKLSETTSSSNPGLHTNAFNVSITSHTFSNGTGTISFSGEVTSIGNSAFYACSGLTSITIPNSVTSIEDYAFKGCSGLTLITIPNSVTNIGDNAFYGCSGLTSITIPDGVTSIRDQAFYDCSGLTSVTIPNSVTSIGNGAFYRCSGLRHIYCYAVNPPRATSTTFEKLSQHLYIHVPASSVIDYQFAEGWSQFLHFYELNPLPDGSSSSDVSVQVTGNSAVFTWPVNPSASSYTLVIQKDGEVFCSLIFNNIGQLVGMNFAPARAANTNSGADQTAYGFSFVVNGLDEQSDYTYTMTAKDANDNVLQSYTGSFVAIQSAIESINETSKATKSLVNGRILIRRGEHTYDLNGRKF